MKNGVMVNVHFRNREEFDANNFSWDSPIIQSAGSFLNKLSFYVQRQLSRLVQRSMRYQHVSLSLAQADFRRLAPEWFLPDQPHTSMLTKEHLVGFTVYREQGVCIQYRLFQNHQYHTWAVMLSEDSVRDMICFACERSRSDFFHSFFDTFIAPGYPDDEAWYCVEFIIQMLQHGGLMHGMNSAAFTADELKYVLQTMYLPQRGITHAPGITSQIRTTKPRTQSYVVDIDSQYDEEEGQTRKRGRHRNLTPTIGLY